MNPGRSIIARGKMAGPGFQIDVNLMRPKSYGTVRLNSNDPMKMPVVDPGYLTHENDVSGLAAGVRYMREVVAQPGYKGIVGQELSPGHSAGTGNEIENAVRSLATTGHHPVCTCPIGADNEPNAVLDNALHVRGVEGLRVIDGSSLPGQTSGNVNAPIIMIAEKAADIVLDRPPLPPEDPRNSK